MIVIAADIEVARQVRVGLGAAWKINYLTATDDPEMVKEAPRQPIVLIAGSGPPGAEAERDQAQRCAARANGGDTFEVALADLQARPDAIMKHLILFASANLLAADPAPQRDCPPPL